MTRWESLCDIFGIRARPTELNFLARQANRGFGDSNSELPGRVYSKFILRDVIVAEVPESRALVRSRFAADDHHFVTEQDALDLLDDEFLSAVSIGADRKYSGWLVGQEKPGFAQDGEAFKKGLA